MKQQPKTTKLAFIVQENKIVEREFRFNFYGGFSLMQKQKTIDDFHKKLGEEGFHNILEVSRKSRDEIGQELSAFSLLVDIDGQKIPVECVYQASKVFDEGRQFSECLRMSPLMAKKTVQENAELNNLHLESFILNGYRFSLYPASLFYDYLYILALNQNERLAALILKYDVFTDIEYNHHRQIASQARSCAVYKVLHQQKLLNNGFIDPQLFVAVYKKIDFITSNLF